MESVIHPGQTSNDSFGDMIPDFSWLCVGCGCMDLSSWYASLVDGSILIYQRLVVKGVLRFRRNGAKYFDFLIEKMRIVKLASTARKEAPQLLAGFEFVGSPIPIFKGDLA